MPEGVHFLKQSLPPSPTLQVSAAGLGGAGMREDPGEVPQCAGLARDRERVCEQGGAGIGCQGVIDGPAF